MMKSLIILIMLSLMPIENVMSPEEMFILDVPSYDQQELGLPTGCEIVSLAMMINYRYSADVTTLADQMPRSSDPNEGYRGNPYRSDGYSIFPSALMELLSDYVGNAIDMTGAEVSTLKEQLISGAPVIVWVNGLGFVVHCITLTGFDENGLYYNDPWTGEKSAYITDEEFYDIWNEPIYDPFNDTYHAPRMALSYTTDSDITSSN